MTDLFKQIVLPLFEEHRADWLEAAREAAYRLALTKADNIITIDEVREICPPPPDIDPRVMGAVLKVDFECVGYVKSARATCHSRPIGLFQLKRAAA